MNKKAVSPLVATILLIAFSLVIGTATMNWGKSYVDKINADELIKTKPDNIQSAIVINTDQIDNPLKELQIQYITGKITKEEYLDEEKKLIS